MDHGNCPCQDNCPTGCPCSDYDCISVDGSTTTTTTTSTTASTTTTTTTMTTASQCQNILIDEVELESGQFDIIQLFPSRVSIRSSPEVNLGCSIVSCISRPYKKAASRPYRFE